MEFEASKQQRKAIRTAFTKTINKLEEVIKSPKPDVDDIDIYLEQLEEKYKILRTIDDKYLELLQKRGCSEDEFDKEYEASHDYYDKYTTLKVKSKKLKTKLTTASISNDESLIQMPTTNQKLPEIELIKFDGDPRNWLSFWTRFSKIHEDKRIDVRDKFHYLLQSTIPDSVPRRIVESFPATEVNYEKAVDYLKQRFGNENVLIQVYIRELLKLVITDKTKIDLLTLYDRLQTQLRALESLGLTQDKFECILFPLVESALPPDLIKVWERQRSMTVETPAGKSDLDLLIDFVKNEVETEFRINITRNVLSSDKLSVKKNKCSDTKYVVPTACELLSTNNNNNSSKHNFNDNLRRNVMNVFFVKRMNVFFVINFICLKIVMMHLR